MSTRFDALVIGTGQAGPSLAARLSAGGMKVAIVERHLFGGTCINNGCTPTKAMVASAYAAHVAHRAGEYGVVCAGEPKTDLRRVKARRDAIVADSRIGLEKWLGGLPNAQLFRGHARFVGPNAVEVDGTRITADRIFLNVGGRPRIPAFAGIDTTPYLTNVSLMDLEVLPEHLIVVGGSYVGLEFAQMFRRFGSRVTIVEMGPHVLGREDADIQLLIEDFLRAEGIVLRLDATCISLQNDGAGVGVTMSCKEGAPREVGSHILLAVGRVPNTDDLGLDRAGIRTDEQGYIEVDAFLCTSNPNVWALGDCNGKGAFTHTSYNDYEIVADNLLLNAGRKHTDRIPVYALYTDPPLGRVGMNEADIRKQGIKAKVGKRPMTRVARAIEKGETRGALKIYIEQESERILGASLLGTGCDEAVQTLLEAVYAGTLHQSVQSHMRIHPTVSELLPTTMEQLTPLE
jgi:pyruvate/2-oxoglutarate dehydrogenase complex dihydrolipoamide dehydrogenase (E3) component